jgi:uncharacterized protein YeaO (DUF488 family)
MAPARPVLKRVYATSAEDDGTRILVDRLWPRGIARNKARIDLWLKDIAPSDALRKRFHKKPEAWQEFCAAYFEELSAPATEAAVQELLAWLRRGPVTLLYAARDEQRNNAEALRIWLGRRKPRRVAEEEQS